MPHRGSPWSGGGPCYHRTDFSREIQVDATQPQPAIDAAPRQPEANLITLTHFIYGLHTLSILIGVLGAVTVIGAFVFGLPSIVAVIINYVRRSEVRGTWLDSHFRWQIRTFWFGLLWVVIAWILVISIVGLLVAWAVFLGAGIWVIYRVVRGWLNLRDGKPMVF
jgi:uncharacterized membrane protein